MTERSMQITINCSVNDDHKWQRVCTIKE